MDRSELDPSLLHVSTWAERYLDSGLSIPMDTAESSASDYDSDDSRSSVETVHLSYSCVPSDVEVRRIKTGQDTFKTERQFALTELKNLIYFGSRYQRSNLRLQCRWLPAKPAPPLHPCEDAYLPFP